MTTIKKFDKDAILALDNEHFSQEEKRQLIEKFFPSIPTPPWKNKLKTQWKDIKLQQHWQRYLNPTADEIKSEAYRYSHEWLVQRASEPIRSLMQAGKRHQSRDGNNVTDFTSWIFSLYNKKIDKESLMNGQMVERTVARMEALPGNKEWEVIYEDPLNGEGQIKLISALTVNGRPLKGRPDIVYREKATGKIVVVERKATNHEIPSDGWPNLRAQLWAYAKIDDWVNAPEVILIGEIWGFYAGRVYLRDIRRWVSGEPIFEKTNIELFEMYRTLYNS
jgi:hypothetical protein